MTTLIGLDLSLAATGLAWWRDGRLGVTTVRTRPADHDHNGWSMPARHRIVMARLVGLIDADERGQVLVCKEDRLHSLEVAGNAALDIAGVHAVADYALAGRGVPIAKVNLRHVKQYATGSGNADKAAMLAAATAAFTPPLLVANDNEADALWLLHMALHRYGAPLFTVPVARAIKLDKVTWPVWRGLDDYMVREATAQLGGTK